MKKKFKMENLDCANCAAKMEDLIRKIPGVHEANMNYMTQKLSLDAEDERFEEILAEAQKCCDRVDKGCRIVTN
ncbi:MAG: heavy-metal-associated domain-containing protein [Oscillospiraceae bacterium]|nr:heavy-metal-associated domain-containing protein [Oscillospiraceae bacterium]